MRLVFSEWTVVVITPRTGETDFDRLLKPQGFGRVDRFADPEDLIALTKAKPQLIVLGPDLAEAVRLKFLKVARQIEALKETPILVFASREETEPGRMADRAHAVRLVRVVGLPLDQAGFNRVVVEFLDPLIDQNQEKAYNLAAKAEKMVESDPEQAAAKYAEALGLYGGLHRAWFRLAQVLDGLNRKDEAEIAFLKALETSPYSLKTYFTLAMFYENRGDTEPARGILQQALGIAVIIGSPDETRSRLAYHTGRLDLTLKRLGDAHESFNEAIQTSPHDAQLRVDIGDAYAQHGFYAEAEPHYQAALLIDPNLAHVYNRLGIAYRKQHKFEKAIDLFTNARQHRPQDENLMFNMARTYFEAGNLADAEALLEEALIQTPGFKEARQLLTKVRASKRVVELEP